MLFRVCGLDGRWWRWDAFHTDDGGASTSGSRVLPERSSAEEAPPREGSEVAADPVADAPWVADPLRRRVRSAEVERFPAFHAAVALGWRVLGRPETYSKV